MICCSERLQKTAGYFSPLHLPSASVAQTRAGELRAICSNGASSSGSRRGILPWDFPSLNDFPGNAGTPQQLWCSPCCFLTLCIERKGEKQPSGSQFLKKRSFKIISAGKVPQMLSRRRKQDIWNLTLFPHHTARSINTFSSKLLAEDIILAH